MRKIMLLPVALAACSTAPAADAPSPAQPLAQVPPGATCHGEGLNAFAGREATPEVGNEILRASGARVLRWVQPGMMVTMEFRDDRVSVWLAPGNRIERVSCG